ncbi:hypothetical protein CBR_g34315 [Chara braunii]|uniref:Translation initiation factor eIF2B subunit delta n=1 Tax=Chara braunii TaxID=69332 RepID=A0A388JYQ6_CHABU|nr:hypothetical protein CBR_g34315 [Chara braunii]|eukprot:GBG62944.1 hypothetical protein CBR_g34315 [Chara braunii]
MAEAPPSAKVVGGTKGGAAAIAGSTEDATHTGKAKGGPLSAPAVGKPKLTKAERREKQEAERAAKALAKAAGGGGKVVVPSGGGGGVQLQKASATAPQKASATAEECTKRSPAGQAVSRKDGGGGGEKKVLHRLPSTPKSEDKLKMAKVAVTGKLPASKDMRMGGVEPFRHLPLSLRSAANQAAAEERFLFCSALGIHPAVYELGMRYLMGGVVGENARCVALLRAFQLMIKDYSLPPHRSFARELTSKIQTHVSFLATCRSLSLCMLNVITWLKMHVGKMDDRLKEGEAKENLIADIRSYVQEKVVQAGKVMAGYTVGKIDDGDVVLTYSCSSVIEIAFFEAQESGKDFSVVVVDSRPRFDGQVLLRRLLQWGVKCSYTHIGALPHAMKSVNKVFLGASAVLANGAVYSRIGSAATAMVAHASNVPVFICCETYKFHERALLDSFCYNELGDPSLLAKPGGGSGIGMASHLDGCAEQEHLHFVNLNYDCMPVDYVTMIICELGIVKPSRVPVILRENRSKDLVVL